MRMNEEHFGTILKDRFDMGLQDTIHQYPGQDLAIKLVSHLSIGDPTEMEIAKYFDTLAITPEARQAAREKYGDAPTLLIRLKEIAAAKGI
jgi:hypothetical protein